MSDLIHKIVGIIIKAGQSDTKKFRLGETIRYSPSEILEILKQHESEFFEEASAQPERKKGKWIVHPEVKNFYGGTYIECSQCGEKYVVQHMEDEKYCRNCGAKMEGVNCDS